MGNLRFLELTIRNFKGFNGEHKLRLSQPPGLYYVSGSNKLHPGLGANGVGKTSLWDAMMWVLWGKTGRDDRPGAAIVPWSGAKAVLGNLLFERGGKKFTLSRSRNPNALKLDGREIAQEEVPRLIGLSEETFRRTLILGQFGTLFLDLKADQQAQMFTEALNLDVWLKAATVAGMAAKEFGQIVMDLTNEQAVVTEVLREFSKQLVLVKIAADRFTEKMTGDLEKCVGKLADVCRRLTQARKLLGKKPVLPQEDSRVASILDSLEGEAESVRQAKFKLQKKSGKLRTCSECGQVIPDENLKVALEELERRSKEQVSSWHEELKKLREERASKDCVYQEQVDAWRFNDNKVQDLLREQQRLEGEKSFLERSVNNDLEEYNRLKTRCRDKRKRMEVLDSDSAVARVKQKQAGFWSKAFKEIRLGIIDEVLLELEIATTRHATLLGLVDWRIGFRTERETEAGTLSYSFTVLLYPPGQNEPIKWESYSGGESQRWQLAVTFGLSEVLLSRAGVEPSLEVLDEPTRGLSSEGIGDLLDHLRDRALELNRAIFLVDHHSLDKGSFDGTLFVAKSEKGSSFVWL